MSNKLGHRVTQHPPRIKPDQLMSEIEASASQSEADIMKRAKHLGLKQQKGESNGQLLQRCRLLENDPEYIEKQRQKASDEEKQRAAIIAQRQVAQRLKERTVL